MATKSELRNSFLAGKPGKSGISKRPSILINGNTTQWYWQLQVSSDGVNFTDITTPVLDDQNATPNVSQVKNSTYRGLYYRMILRSYPTIEYTLRPGSNSDNAAGGNR